MLDSSAYLNGKDKNELGVENSIDDKDWYKMDYNDKICIVFGSEGKGI